MNAALKPNPTPQEFDSNPYQAGYVSGLLVSADVIHKKFYSDAKYSGNGTVESFSDECMRPIWGLIRKYEAVRGLREEPFVLAEKCLLEGLAGIADCPENEGMIRGYKAAISRLQNSR